MQNDASDWASLPLGAHSAFIGTCAATEEQELADVYHDQGDVVLLEPSMDGCLWADFSFR
jgi:hypothetical protein